MKVYLVLLLSGFSRRFGSNKLFADWRGHPLYRAALEQALDSGADHVIVVTAYQEIIKACRALESEEGRRPAVRLVYNPHPERGISESIKLGIRAFYKKSFIYDMGSVENETIMPGVMGISGKSPEPDTQEISRKFSKSVMQSVEKESNGTGVQNMTDDSEERTGCCFLTGDMPFLKPASLKRLVNVFRQEPNFIYMMSDGEHFGNPAVFPKEFYPDLLALSGDRGGKQVAMSYPDRIRLVTAQSEGELQDIDYKTDMGQIKKNGVR